MDKLFGNLHCNINVRLLGIISVNATKLMITQRDLAQQ